MNSEKEFFILLEKKIVWHFYLPEEFENIFYGKI